MSCVGIVVHRHTRYVAVRSSSLPTSQQQQHHEVHLHIEHGVRHRKAERRGFLITCIIPAAIAVMWDLQAALIVLCVIVPTLSFPLA